MRGLSLWMGTATSLLFSSTLVNGARAQVEFAKEVWPILEARCVDCHREAHRDDRGRMRQPKAGLRLDGKGWILKGGDEGRVIVPGMARESSLVQRVSLAPDHPDVMPPKGELLTAAQVDRLRSWVDAGADFGSWIGAGGPKATVEASELPPSTKPRHVQVFERLSKDLKALDPTLVASVAGERARIVPLFTGSPLLRVEFPSHQDEVDDRVVRGLGPLAAHVAILDLGRTQVTDAGLRALARFEHLVELDLHESRVTSRGLGELAQLENLAKLNLHHTAVDDDVIATLANLRSLTRVYLWETEVSAGGAQRLRQARSDLKVQHQIELPDPPAPEDSARQGRRRGNE
ncbi:MAG: hypothetical protein H6833_06080 [Planctomycetes bacterium]|nr:hypothetical protein [Planctomycetota bacterium]